MSQTVLTTAGQYSDYHIEALLNVPSMDWLRERFIEYRSLKAGLEAWADEHGYYPARSGTLDDLLASPWTAVLDREQLDRSEYVEEMSFGAWLKSAYGDVVSEPEYEVLHLEDY